MVYEITTQTILIFAAFIIVVFVLYKLFRVLMRGVIAGAAGFAFPWIVQYLNLPLNITANMQTGIQFAIIAIALFLIYEFFYFIKYLLKILAWPLKSMVKKK